jgi:signal peptidase I
MSPTLEPGDRMMVSAFRYRFGLPQAGDVVAFRTDGLPIEGPSSVYVERIAAGPGDRVEITGGKLLVNGRVFVSRAGPEVRFDSAPMRSTYMKMTVPADHYYMVGDNPTRSTDSRKWGPVARENLIGRATFRLTARGRVNAIQ